MNGAKETKQQNFKIKMEIIGRDEERCKLGKLDRVDHLHDQLAICMVSQSRSIGVVVTCNYMCSKLCAVYSLDLLPSYLSNGAKGRNFYSHLLNYVNEGSPNPGNNCNLVTRCKQICSKNCISLYRYVLDDDYRSQYKRQLKT